MSLKSSVLNASACLLELVYPKVCIACGTHLFADEVEICKMCLNHLPKTGFEKHPDDNAISAMLWGRCSVESAYSLYYYRKGERIQSLLHAVKYKGNKALGHALGKQLGKNIKSSHKEFDVIVPIPLHPMKQLKRGFNQSEVIAEGTKEILSIPVDASIVHRRKFTSTQTRKSRFDRWKNVENIFTLNESSSLKGKSVLVIDDVITTGSTMEACVNSLSEIENIKISIATIACAVL
jgi:ComF family protein